MSRPNHKAILAALLAAVGDHPRDLTRFVASQLGVSRQTTASYVRALIEADFLAKSGTTRPVYSLGPKRHTEVELPLAGLTEDAVWSRIVAPYIYDVPPNVIDTAHYALTEMVNNAIDHSEGATLQVTVTVVPPSLIMRVTDDGVGIFRKITRALNLSDERLACLELSKGKFTTDPSSHTGEGIFFTSRACDTFEIRSDALKLCHASKVTELDVLFDVEQKERKPGTSVLMSIDLSADRTLSELFERFSSGPDDHSFAKTVVPVKLAQIGHENLISRSQAKRLMQRLEKFQNVVLDFADVATIGPAFADEIFRVFATEHPLVRLATMNESPDVRLMIKRAYAAR